MKARIEEGIAPTKLAELLGYASPYDMGRAYYKYTACGPWTVFHCRTVWHEPTYNDPYAERGGSVSIYYDSEDGRKTWTQLESEGITEIVGVEIGSIVEGVDETAAPVLVDTTGNPADIDAALDAALMDVNEQCNDIWQDTHGCESCAAHFGVSLDDTYSPVWEDCPDCGGGGVSI